MNVVNHRAILGMIEFREGMHAPLWTTARPAKFQQRLSLLGRIERHGSGNFGGHTSTDGPMIKSF
jgi:hypothetical protein